MIDEYRHAQQRHYFPVHLMHSRDNRNRCAGTCAMIRMQLGSVRVDGHGNKGERVLKNRKSRFKKARSLGAFHRDGSEARPLAPMNFLIGHEI